MRENLSKNLQELHLPPNEFYRSVEEGEADKKLPSRAASIRAWFAGSRYHSGHAHRLCFSSHLCLAAITQEYADENMHPPASYI